jgi:hypothetical protein
MYVQEHISAYIKTEYEKGNTTWEIFYLEWGT